MKMLFIIISSFTLFAVHASFYDQFYDQLPSQLKQELHKIMKQDELKKLCNEQTNPELQLICLAKKNRDSQFCENVKSDQAWLLCQGVARRGDALRASSDEESMNLAKYCSLDGLINDYSHFCLSSLFGATAVTDLMLYGKSEGQYYGCFAIKNKGLRQLCRELVL